MPKRRYDWEKLLRFENQEPLPPSCMQWLDTSLDQNSTMSGFVSVMTRQYQELGRSVPSQRAYQDAAKCDLATMNLIATHYRKLIVNNERLTAIFSERFTPDDVRRFALSKLTLPKSINSIKPFDIAQSYTDELKEYPLHTDEGFIAQMALMEVIIQVNIAFSERREAEGIFMNRGAYATSDSQMPAEKKMVRYILQNPSKAHAVAGFITRKMSDPDVIIDTIEDTSPALLEGVL